MNPAQIEAIILGIATAIRLIETLKSALAAKDIPAADLGMDTLQTTVDRMKAEGKIPQDFRI